MSEQNSESFFSKIHTARYTWHDFFLIPALLIIVIELGSQILGLPLETFFKYVFDQSVDYNVIFVMYLVTIASWIGTCLYMAVTKYNRPIFRVITKEPKGNTVKMLLLGLLVGFAQNAFCILIAVLHKDIHLGFSRFEFLRLLFLFIAVFIQSSSEELLCRGFLYQRLRRGYKSPYVAIIGNAVIFAVLHLFNPGITAVSFVNIVLVAVFYSFMIYYFNSIWFTMAAHTAWNFTQNILFGLPNSGIVSPYSVMQLEASTARDSWIYNVLFGVEGTILAALVLLASIAVTIVIGKKYGQPELDIWAETEQQPSN